MAARESLIISLLIVLEISILANGLELYEHGLNMKTKRPLVIAHRGSSGKYPEHTVQAYQQAVADGADFIECDVSITKDLQLVCLHESWLQAQTDVESRPEFASRRKTYTVHGKTIVDWFSVDFTLTELKMLKKRQTIEGRNQEYDGKFQIATLDEYIQVAKNAGRLVGIYPELKNPEWVNSLDIMAHNKFEDILLHKLRRRGYSQKSDLCFVQTFSERSLLYVYNRTELPLVILTSEDVEDAKLSEWKKYVYGIGVWKDLIVKSWSVDNDYLNWIKNTSNLVSQVHRLGMKLHAYTFRNDDRYLAWDFNMDPYKEYEYFYRFHIDGYFTDFPATFKTYLDNLYDGKKNVKPSCIHSSGRRAEASLGIFYVIIITLLTAAENIHVI